jgi:hypothetical protein
VWFIVALSQACGDTRNGPTGAGVSLPPALPGTILPAVPVLDLESWLSLAYGCGAAHGVDIPELHAGGHILYADLTLHFRSVFAQPYYAKLRLGGLILEIDDGTRFQLNADALQRGATSADGAQAGALREGPGVRVHAPDFYGKLDEYT